MIVKLEAYDEETDTWTVSMVIPAERIPLDATENEPLDAIGKTREIDLS